MNEKRLLIDTSYVVAHFYAEDPHHAKALRIQDDVMNGKWDELVLLDAVFHEVVTVLGRLAGFGKAKTIGRLLRDGEEIALAHSGPLLDMAWDEFVSQERPRLGLVDCTLIAASRQYGIPDIATFDRGFDDVPGVRRVPVEPVTQAATASP